MQTWPLPRATSASNISSATTERSSSSRCTSPASSADSGTSAYGSPRNAALASRKKPIASAEWPSRIASRAPATSIRTACSIDIDTLGIESIAPCAFNDGRTNREPCAAASRAPAASCGRTVAAARATAHPPGHRRRPARRACRRRGEQRPLCGRKPNHRGPVRQLNRSEDPDTSTGPSGPTCSTASWL